VAKDWIGERRRGDDLDLHRINGVTRVVPV
jgi:hypothetical protein